MGEIFSVSLQTGSYLMEEAAVATTVRYATTNDAKKNECYNETDFINIIRMLQRTNATTNRFY